jgi:large conductance mechanosensitive channel
MGGVNFSDLFINLDAAKGTFPSLKAAKDAGAAVIAYGSFINTIIDFAIVAFCIFLVVKGMNAMKKAPPAPAPAPEPTKDQKLLMEIRDVLKTRV